MLHARPLASVALAAVLVAVAGCGGEAAPSASAGTTSPSATGGGGSSPAVEPRTQDAAQRAAETQFEAMGAGDYGAAWDQWTAEAQGVLSRSEYLRLNELCKPAAEGVPIELKNVRLEDGGTAVVRAERLGFQFTYEFVHDGARWRFVPTDEAMKEYRRGPAAKIAAARKAEGRCA